MNNSLNQDGNKCAWCNESALSTCGKCNQVFYCGREHQIKHWANHKTHCKPYRIVQSESSGRYLVANKFLPAGTLIIQECPFVIGPKATSPLVCLTCHIPIIVKNFNRCINCQWPMCSTECSESSKHIEECNILKLDVKQCGVPQHQGETPRYDLILVLRCLLFQLSNPELWETIQNMESHYQRRKEDAEPHHMAAVRYLTEVCKVGFEVDVVHQVRGAVITNAINTKSSTGTTLRGLYSTISLLNHSCYPNITLRSDKNHTLYIRATKDICKDEPLSFSYVSTMSPIWSRQEDLKSIYYFSCKCIRCADPSEMNTYFSNPLCQKCTNEFLTNQSNENQWQCNQCMNEQSFKDIVKQSNSYLNDISNKKLTQKYLKLFLKGVAEKYHKQHFLYLEALQIALAFLKEKNSLESNYLKIEIWKEILGILGTLEPGSTRRKGISLLEKSTIELQILEKEKFRSKEKVQRPLLEDLVSEIEEASSILNLEPPGSTEESWKDLASEKLRAVKKLQDSQTDKI